MKILVVDDSSVMRKMIIRTIRMCGLDIHTIYEAADGKEGLEILENHSVDIAFVDVNMPVMDGMQMLREIRNHPAIHDLPVMIVSTESNQGRIKTIEQYNADFVHKPFTPEQMRAHILKILRPAPEA